MNKLAELLDQFEKKISFCDNANQRVSKANVGWHIEHSLLTLSRISYALSRSNPEHYKWKFRLIRIVVLTMGKIPRGRAQSPEVVRPKGTITIDRLSTHLSRTREIIKQLESMSSDKFFEHPYFGDLRLKQAVNFLEIHSKHHLEIIDDILK